MMYLYREYRSWELAQTWEPPISVEDKAVIICNRAASYLLLKNFDKAELDATSAIEVIMQCIIIMNS